MVILGRMGVPNATAPTAGIDLHQTRFTFKDYRDKTTAPQRQHAA
jgi:hypothetical protein